MTSQEEQANPGPSSIDLVRQAQTGVEGALDELFRRYYERVRNVVRARLGRKLREVLDSGDILQETFIGAIHQFQRFEMRDEGSLLNWLCTIAERKICAAADFHGAQKRSCLRQLGIGRLRSTGGHPVELASSDPLPLEQIVHNEELEAVDGCLTDELREEYREVVVLRDYAHASWDTVTVLIGASSPDAARMLHARAVTRLGRLLGRHGLPR